MLQTLPKSWVYCTLHSDSHKIFPLCAELLHPVSLSVPHQHSTKVPTILRTPTLNQFIFLVYIISLILPPSIHFIHFLTFLWPFPFPPNKMKNKNPYFCQSEKPSNLSALAVFYRVIFFFLINIWSAHRPNDNKVYSNHLNTQSDLTYYNISSILVT